MTWLGGWLLVASQAGASCGDYLLHGPLHPATLHPATSGESVLSLGVSGSDAVDGDQPVPTLPNSPCASGRCQSAPLSPPANSPVRAVYDKQPVPLERFVLLATEDDSADWLRPADGTRPDAPWIAIPSPPPERARLHA